MKMRPINAETFPNKLKEMMIQIDKNGGKPEEDWFLYGFDEFVLALDVIDLVKEMPTVDAVPVVRCKNCRYFNKYGFKLEYTECTHFDCDVSEDGYCAWGETKDE